MTDHDVSDCCPPEEGAPDLRPVEGADADMELASLAKAVGHPLRVRILRMLSASVNAGCGDLVAQLPVAQSTVSEHLRVLREAGLVQGEVDGPRSSYCLRPSGMRRLRALVGAL